MELNLKELAQQYFFAFSNQDLNGLGEMLTFDCVLKDWENEFIGKEEVVEANKKIFSSVETIEAKPLNIYIAGNTVIGELLITVNNEKEMAVVDIIEFDSTGKIKKIRAYQG